MKQIYQLVHTLSYGDAISGEVLALHRAFEESGRESKIFAVHEHPKLKGSSISHTDFPVDFDGTVILHYSIGSPINGVYRNLEKANRVIIYHNLTPVHWFEKINPRVRDDLKAGFQELPELCALSDRIIADSSFNASEIRDHGFEAEVLNLSVDPARWDEPTNPGIAAAIQGAPGIHLLHVGRLAPNKCIEDIIKIFYFLHHYVEKNSQLWLPGIDIDTELYSFSLKRLVHELDLERAVHFCGCVADSELRAMYEHCTAYVCMSEHEGFCLPAVEAMHFGMPVIAYASSALPDTVGSGGILIQEKRHAEIAELIAEIHNNQTLRDDLIRRGKSRSAELSFENFRDRALQLFSSEKLSSVGNTG